MDSLLDAALIDLLVGTLLLAIVIATYLAVLAWEDDEFPNDPKPVKGDKADGLEATIPTDKAS